MEKTIPVAEIFGPTIQGEGPHVGLKTLFVRVAGCDFKCSWCDSKFAWDAQKATKYTGKELTDTLISMCENTNTSNIILTGGNPCLYNFETIIEGLKEKGIHLDVETQGSFLPSWLNKLDLVVISPKGPSSGQPSVFKNIEKWLKHDRDINVPLAIKIPIFNDEDLIFAKEYYNLINKYENVSLYLSVGNTNTKEEGSISSRILDQYELLISKIMEDKDLSRVYILPQIHTLVWGNKTGV